MKNTGLTLLLLVLAAGAYLAYGSTTHTASTHASIAFQDTDQITGKPSVTAVLINQVLDLYHSPAAGKGQTLYNLGVTYGIDPAFALAFFFYESTFGTRGEARATRGLGNERCIPDRPCIDRDRGGYAQFYSWEDGFEHWYQLMRDGYVQGEINKALGRAACPCLTIEQIVPVYAPARDKNNEADYIHAVESAVATWRAGRVAV